MVFGYDSGILVKGEDHHHIRDLESFIPVLAWVRGFILPTKLSDSSTDKSNFADCHMPTIETLRNQGSNSSDQEPVPSCPRVD